jgi:hypothetical protein
MPNHLHGIVWIHKDKSNNVGASGRSPLRTTQLARFPDLSLWNGPNPLIDLLHKQS